MAIFRSAFAVFAIAAGAVLGLALARGYAVEGEADPGKARFAMLDVRVETGDVPLAAYQIEIHATAGDVRIVGIEGGEHAEFAEPPYYDPAAMQSSQPSGLQGQDRVIIAAFSTAPAPKLPSGSTRVATIHLQITGDIEPVFARTLQAAAGADDRAIDARINCTLRSAP